MAEPSQVCARASVARGWRRTQCTRLPLLLARQPFPAGTQRLSARGALRSDFASVEEEL